MSLFPGRIPAFLADGDLGLLRADDRVFEAMLDGWRAHLLARGLTTSYIKSSSSVVLRFQEHSNEYPWSWSAHHVEEFLADRRSSGRPVTVSTLRANAGAIRAFCVYLTDPRYEWVPFCEKVFHDIPAQVVFEWNSPRHTTDDAAPPRRRSFTKLQSGNGTYSVDARTSIFDYYNFETTDQKPWPQASDLNKLHRAGWAQNFDTIGSSSVQTSTWP